MSNIKIVNCKTNYGLHFEQLWQTVRTNPNDFVSWTLLLQYCEHSKDLNSIRKSFGEFLTLYPNCYVYWKKLAEYELQLSDTNNALKVLETAVTVFPISIDIWIHYIKIFLKFNSNQKEILQLFERAIRQSGQDFNSSELWSLYLNWLTTNNLFSAVTLLYDRLFQVGVKTLSQHFHNFVEFVEKSVPNDIIVPNEYNFLENEYFRQQSNNKSAIENYPMQTNENIAGTLNGENPLKFENKIDFIRNKIIEERKKIFEKTLKEVEERTVFENRIKRPYFHVNPLDIKQLDNWMQYLNWEISHTFPTKVIFLFERCLVACALYEHMWIRYSDYLIEKRYQMMESGEEFFENFDLNTIRNVFRRATEVHTKGSFKIHNLWALFEEREGNFDEALHILDKFEKERPHLIETTISKINLLHRKRDLIAVENQFEGSIERFIDFPKLCSHLSIKYSRFLYKVRRNTEKATDVLNAALKYDPNNYVLYLRLIDIEYQKPELSVTEIENLFDKMIACIQSHSLKISMTQKKLEFMQDFGVECQKVQTTIYGIQGLMNACNQQNESIPSKGAKRLKADK